MSSITFTPAELPNLDAETACQRILEEAMRLSSSDLFVMSSEKSTIVAVRRLGTMHNLAMLPRDQGRHIVSYVKAMAGMDISEHKKPADGRWIHEFGDHALDIRINCIPTLYGEDIALRMWDRKKGIMSLESLGMLQEERQILLNMLNSPSGLLLVTGPTGTGKTTTLYACLEQLNDGNRKINTLEDPIEYSLEGVRQSQVNQKQGLGFPELLRGVLRQAPDIIMVGEIRDEDTATTAVRAANSGHLVLATLHAPAAAAAVQSMLSLGAHPYYLSSCLLGVVAQRLIRTLCPKCRVQFDISASTETFRDVSDLLGPTEGKAIYGPCGCHECYEVGYSGRTGLFEVMNVNSEIRRLVAQAAVSDVVQPAAVSAGMIELRRGALLRVARGITSTEEILRDVPIEYLGISD